MEIARTEAIDRLFESILSLGSIDECYEYFEDLCTVKEITDMSQRLEAAVKLDEGDVFRHRGRGTAARTQ